MLNILFKMSGIVRVKNKMCERVKQYKHLPESRGREVTPRYNVCAKVSL